MPSTRASGAGGRPAPGRTGGRRGRPGAGTAPASRSPAARGGRRGTRWPRSTSGAAALGCQEQLEDLGGAGQPAQGDRAELVAAGLGVAVGDQVGDPVDHGVDPDRVAGGRRGRSGAAARTRRSGTARRSVAAVVPRPGPRGRRGRPGSPWPRRSPAPDPVPHRRAPRRPRHRRGPPDRPAARRESRAILRGQPHRAGQLLGARPDLRQPVDQVQHVGQVSAHTPSRSPPAPWPAPGCENSRTPGVPVPAGMHQPVRRPRPTPGLRDRAGVGGVHDGPGRDHPKVIDLRGTTTQHRMLGQLQKRIGRQPGQILGQILTGLSSARVPIHRWYGTGVRRATSWLHDRDSWHARLMIANLDA